MLDSLDQLSPEDSAHMVTWLPKQLPKNIKFIVSTLPGEEYKVMPNLKVSSELTKYGLCCVFSMYLSCKFSQNMIKRIVCYLKIHRNLNRHSKYIEHINVYCIAR